MAKRLPSVPPVISGFTSIRPLGTGGFSDVFLYEQDFPKREVAVKVMLDASGDSDQLKMFATEADALARLSSHPAILSVFQASRATDGRPYLVMEYCPDSYATAYREYLLSVGEVLDVSVRMAGALETVHRAGILHRDIKPSNILRTPTGSPVLSDFGVASARFFNIDDDRVAMSVPWAAPEIITEQTAGSTASDIWSLGATVYSLLAGHSPFEREGAGENSVEKLQGRIRRAKYAPIGRDDVPDELEAVLARAMSHDPASRQSTAEIFGQQLQAVQRQLGLAVTELEILGDRSVTESMRNMSQPSNVTGRIPRQISTGHEGRTSGINPRPGPHKIRRTLDDLPITTAKQKISPRMAVIIASLGAVAAVLAVVMLVLGG